MDFEKYVINALERIQEQQEKTLVQTTKTNGRVTQLEEWHQEKIKKLDALVNESNNSKGRDKILTYLVVTALTSIGIIFGFIINNFISKNL